MIPCTVVSEYFNPHFLSYYSNFRLLGLETPFLSYSWNNTLKTRKILMSQKIYNISFGIYQKGRDIENSLIKFFLACQLKFAKSYLEFFISTPLSRNVFFVLGESTFKI